MSWMNVVCFGAAIYYYNHLFMRRFNYGVVKVTGAVAPVLY